MHYLTVFQPFKCPHCFIVYRSQAKFYFHKRLAHGIGKPVGNPLVMSGWFLVHDGAIRWRHVHEHAGAPRRYDELRENVAHLA